MSSVTEHRPRLLMEVAEGRVASAILGSGFLDHATRLGAEVEVLSPGAVYPPFVGRYRLDDVTFTPISHDTPVKGRGKLAYYEQRLGRRLAQRRLPRLRRLLWEKVGAPLAAAEAGRLAEVLDRSRVDCFVVSDVNMGFGRGLVGACRRRGIPTLGNIFSWDHPFYEHPSRPDVVACWSPKVKTELIRRSGFEPERVRVIGAPAYDLYVDPAGEWTREQLCRRMGLDPDRPILVFATLGQMKKFFDETDTFRALLDELDAGRIPHRPQVVLRLHPVTVDRYFHELASRPDVVVSRYVGYSPGMRWWPSHDEVLLAGNLLRHADVCLSPGSSMAIEPAIFDTPTIVPVFNRYMPEEYERFFNRFWMSRHFGWLAERKLLPFARSPEEMVGAVRRALDDPGWMREERRAIRDEIFGPLDGRAAERLASLAVDLAAGRPLREDAENRTGTMERA